MGLEQFLFCLWRVPGLSRRSLHLFHSVWALMFAFFTEKEEYESKLWALTAAAVRRRVGVFLPLTFTNKEKMRGKNLLGGKMFPLHQTVSAHSPAAIERISLNASPVLSLTSKHSSEGVRPLGRAIQRNLRQSSDASSWSWKWLRGRLWI